MTGKDCLHMVFNQSTLVPDFHPVNLKQAKKQMKNACIGKKSTGSLIGLHFRLEYLSEEERVKFQSWTNKICDNTIKKWNKVNK